MSTLSNLIDQRDSLLQQLKNVDSQISNLLGKSAYVKVGNNELPMISADSGKETITTAVNAARNANAVVVGQKIGRDQSKIELSWSYLDKNTWSEILSIFENSFFNDVTYFDMQKNRRITRKMYVGDRSARPFKLDENNNPTGYLECQLNLIDTGG